MCPQACGRTARDEMIVKVLDVLSPVDTGYSDQRIPIFEWGHETTPTPEEMTEMAGDIVDAIYPER